VATYGQRDWEERKTQVRGKVLTALELLRADDCNSKVEGEALDLIESVCLESGVECDVGFASKLLRASQSSWESVRHDLIETVKGGKHRQAMSALMKSLHHAAEHDTVMALLRYFLRELRHMQAVPHRDAAWAYRFAAKPILQPPNNLLTLQKVTIQYQYRNNAAEQATAAPEISANSAAQTYHPVLGWSGQKLEDLQVKLEDLKAKGLVSADAITHLRPPRLATPEPHEPKSLSVSLHKEAESPESRPKNTVPTNLSKKGNSEESRPNDALDQVKKGARIGGALKAVEAVDSEESSGHEGGHAAEPALIRDAAGHGEMDAEVQEGTKSPPPPSETQLLVQELKEDIVALRQDQVRRQLNTTMRDEFELNRIQQALHTEMCKRLAPATVLLQHPEGDWVGVCRLSTLDTHSTHEKLGDQLKGLTHMALTEDLDEEIQAISRKAEYLKALEVFVDVMPVPAENEG